MVKEKEIKNLVGLGQTEQLSPKHMSVRVSQEEFLRLRDYAAERGIPQSELLRKLLEPALEMLMHVRG